MGGAGFSHFKCAAFKTVETEAIRHRSSKPLLNFLTQNCRCYLRPHGQLVLLLALPLILEVELIERSRVGVFYFMVKAPVEIGAREEPCKHQVDPPSR